MVPSQVTPTSHVVLSFSFRSTRHLHINKNNYLFSCNMELLLLPLTKISLFNTVVFHIRNRLLKPAFKKALHSKKNINLFLCVGVELVALFYYNLYIRLSSSVDFNLNGFNYKSAIDYDRPGLTASGVDGHY